MHVGWVLVATFGLSALARADVTVQLPAVSADGKSVAVQGNSRQPCGKYNSTAHVSAIGKPEATGIDYLVWDACVDVDLDGQSARSPAAKVLAAGGYTALPTEERFPKSGGGDELTLYEVTFANNRGAVTARVGTTVIGRVANPAGGYLQLVALVEGKQRWGYVQLRTWGDDSVAHDRWIAFPLKTLPWRKHPNVVAWEKYASAICACTDAKCAEDNKDRPFVEGPHRQTQKDEQLRDAEAARASACESKLKYPATK